MGDADAEGCCTLKRGFGIFILVLSIISLVGSIICAVIASATEMGLYAAFNWIHFVLLIYLISAASAYVCCRACGSKITGGLAVGYCVLAFVTFIVLATGQRSAIKHNCEGTVECASISDWGDHDPECGRKTSSFSLCYLPETDERRRRLASSYAPKTDERRRRLATGCRSDICTDIGNDCCAPGGEARGCSLAGYEVQADWVGSSGWGDCVGTYGQESVYQCCSNTCDYVAVSGRGCESYIHMDGGWYGDRWLWGGSTSLEDCAAAVRAYDGQDGCRGAYFFYETGGYCNCPTDDCELGYENGNAGGPGQLYQYGCGVDVDVAPTWYYSKWGDDCQHDGGDDDHCRAFRTQDDCINYCNPWDDDADEQCEDADDPEDCNSIVTHVNTVAGWSTFFAGLVLFPTLVWVALLCAVPDPQAAAPVTAVELPRMQPQVMMVSPVSPGGGQPQVIMGQPQIVQGGQPQGIMGQPQVVQGGQPQVIMGQPQVVQGAPSKLAEF